MTQKDYIMLVNNVSNDIIKPLNQILFQCLVLIIFYYMFNKIPYMHSKSLHNKSLHHKSFIILVAIICIILNWFIWNNYINTILFSSILLIYITYNFALSKQISSFIDIMNDNKDINKRNNNIYNNQIEIEEREKKEIEEITFIPKDIDLHKNKIPDAFDKKKDNKLNELNDAFIQTSKPIHIVDSKYAEVMLASLYNTPQYNNIIKNPVDDKLNDISIILDNSDTDNNKNNKNNNKNNKNNKNNNKNNDIDIDIDLFRHPKKEFIDDKWITLKENTYNDNCKNCKDNKNTSDTNTNKPRNKNAICSLVKFGYELNECSDDINKVNNYQLENISNNKITSSTYKF